MSRVEGLGLTVSPEQYLRLALIPLIIVWVTILDCLNLLQVIFLFVSASYRN
jgi:hypothetical protein